jgi:hypothetical protein
MRYFQTDITGETEMIKEFPYCKYHDGGIIEVFGNEYGLPIITGVIPAPDINTKDEIERQKRYDEAIDGITLQGYIIISKKLIRNEGFDKKGQKTTLKLSYRPCKNKQEIEQVYFKILNILGQDIGEYSIIENGVVPK